jgi:hypothetical protein
VILEELEPYNILLGDRGPIICEFGHASIGHTCPGVSECHELSYISEVLEINSEEWFGDWPLTIHEGQAELSSDEALNTRNVLKAGIDESRTGVTPSLTNGSRKAHSHQGVTSSQQHLSLISEQRCSTV